jgi:hypothetical protein
MKANFDRSAKVRTVALFGDAQLVRHTNGRYELCGGSPADQTVAKEWISLFLHQAVVSFPPPSRDLAFCEQAMNLSRLNICHSARAASPCHETQKPWVNVSLNEDLNGRLTNRKPLQE